MSQSIRGGWAWRVPVRPLVPARVCKKVEFVRRFFDCERFETQNCAGHRWGHQTFGIEDTKIKLCLHPYYLSCMRAHNHILLIIVYACIHPQICLKYMSANRIIIFICNECTRYNFNFVCIHARKSMLYYHFGWMNARNHIFVCMYPHINTLIFIRMRGSTPCYVMPTTTIFFVCIRTIALIIFV